MAGTEAGTRSAVGSLAEAEAVADQPIRSMRPNPKLAPTRTIHEFWPPVGEGSADAVGVSTEKVLPRDQRSYTCRFGHLGGEAFDRVSGAVHQADGDSQVVAVAVDHERLAGGDADPLGGELNESGSLVRNGHPDVDPVGAGCFQAVLAECLHEGCSAVAVLDPGGLNLAHWAGFGEERKQDRLKNSAAPTGADEPAGSDRVYHRRGTSGGG